MSERGNPEALREAAAGWREMGKHLDGLVRDLDRHVGTAAAANWHGPAGEAFAGEWHRLKRCVDDSLPVFELAAADLETAAAQPADDQGGKDHGTPPVHHAADGAQSSSGPEIAYGFMALGQLANGLGGAFGRRGGGGGRGQRPPVRHEWETSTAAQGPDPFGPAQGGEATRRGGEGVAKGVRGRPSGTEPEPAPASGHERDLKTGPRKKETAAPAAEPAPRAAAAATADAPKAQAPAASGGDAPGSAPGSPGPDITRHGAFG
ncbi:WXG100 family type VII secretion target [Streptomyces sp. DSM 41527]|uniref:WXG100 family type VII secretion target n=1 Tax=Streptomyces mooreae TaxID=3075523 RepID=A0ABU2TBE6_9ACTN|nr:WXG100 family type VII secretion target [Streptomyces sp. DSM 41527]MDT0458253.1 WXG100 family type VII secretion target [Streptomyces sp. DSM 41527]